MLEQLHADYEAVKHQLDWFKRYLFGQNSEKRLDIDPAEQLNLLAGLGIAESNCTGVWPGYNRTGGLPPSGEVPGGWHSSDRQQVGFKLVVGYPR